MTSTARTGRRRRMLHEGASAPTTAPGSGEPQTATRQRYTPREGSASFAVAASVLPRSPLAMLSVAAMAAVAIGGLVWADGLAGGLATTGVTAQAAQLLAIDQPGGLARWYEGSLWLAVAVQSVLLFGMRKHRTNDTGGAYRWWLVVAGVAIGMSVGVTTRADGAIASQLAALTGFSPLAGDAFWWLVPGGVVLTALAVRSLLEIKESPLAGAAGALAVAAVATGWIASAGLAPQAAGGVSLALVGPVASLVGASLTLIALLAYSRRIVRETLGELAPPLPAAKPAKAAANEEEAEAVPMTKQATPAKPVAKHVMKVAEQTRDREPAAEPERVPTAAQRRAERKRAKQQVEETQWVSGPEGDDDYDDGPERRKLSKAERKRLRREKERRAA